MKNEFKNTFRERLEFLMKERGINTAEKGANTKLAKDMLKTKCLPFYVNETLKAQESARVRIGEHRKVLSAESIEGKWLKAYCDYFGCSADFLFGYISLPTHKESDIQENINMSYSAIQKMMAGDNYLLDLIVNSKEYFEIDYMFNQMMELYKYSKERAIKCYELEKEFEEKKGDTLEEQKIDSEYRIYERLITQNGEKCDGSIYRIGIKFGNILEEYRRKEIKEIQSILNIKSEFT